MLQKYTPSTEAQMQEFYSKLGERERRHYAAIEAKKLPYGGKKYIQELLGIHHKTLKRALDELDHPELCKPLPTVKQRRAGGGRKKKHFTSPIFAPNCTP